MPHSHVPCPCVVFARQVSSAKYTYSHHCHGHVTKLLPASLRLADLRTHDRSVNWRELQRACFLVLVAGDVAQCVTVGNARDTGRVQFLYKGSAFAIPDTRCKTASEVAESHVSLPFHGTMAVFDTRATLSAIVPLESGIALFPREIRETDVPLLAHWVEQCMQRSLQASVWVSASGDAYNELTQEPTHSMRVKNRIF